ncbi:60S ribosomal protein L31 [Candidatus Woesearchaeota archaeon]|nr:60S ribosomal protein L31 [Candidatus Woesearchaeota archaeon]
MTEQEIERIYNVPLRKEAMKVPKYVRAAKASRALREFLVKHMKSENVKIGRYLNQAILKNGRKNVPHHVLVKTIKDKTGIVKAELVGAPEEKIPEKPVKEVAKKEEVRALMDKVDSEAVKKEQQEEEKKKVLEQPTTEKKKIGIEIKELTKEQEEKIRGKDRPKRKDKKEMIAK